MVGAKRKHEDSKDMKKDVGLDTETVRFSKFEFDEPTCSIKIKQKTSNQSGIKNAFKNAASVKKDGAFYILSYASKEHALVDMKANRRVDRRGNSEYMDNKFILINLSYKETEESISEVFKKYGKIEKILIQRNKDGISVGRAVITFEKRAVIRDEIVMSSKPIYIERIRKPLENKTRFFLSNIEKSLSIVAIRKILADAKCKPKDIRVIYSENNRNKGYGFIEYDSKEKADVFIDRFKDVRALLGAGSSYEYSNEKANPRRRRR